MGNIYSDTNEPKKGNLTSKKGKQKSLVSKNHIGWHLAVQKSKESFFKLESELFFGEPLILSHCLLKNFIVKHI